MKAIGTTARGGIQALERPSVEVIQPDDVLVRVVRVGICATDRRLIERGGTPANGNNTLVLGHEMLGRVLAIGSEVISVKPGDFVAATVRRGCNTCANCAAGQSDLCTTGAYTERGIVRQDGYLAELILESEKHLVQVPDDLSDLAVLAEPLSICEKAIRQAVDLQARALPRSGSAWDAADWGTGKTAVVTGIGPIGLLATMILRSEGVTTVAVDRIPADSFKASLVTKIGATYLNTQDSDYARLAADAGPVDLMVECTASTQLAFEWIERLAHNACGVFVSHGDSHQIDAGRLMGRMVGRNQLLFGTVNSNRSHFERALADLAIFRKQWGALIDQVITHRYAFDDWQTAFRSGGGDQIKVVLEAQ